MSRFPGLSFPVSGSEQPLTREQQRPQDDLLSRLFAMKSDKLATQDQQFQEDSFDAAKGAYEDSLSDYTQKYNAYSSQAAEQARLAAFASVYSPTNPNGWYFGNFGGTEKVLGKVGEGLSQPPVGQTYTSNSPEYKVWSGQPVTQVSPITASNPGSAPSFNYSASASPNAVSVNKLNLLADWSDQLGGYGAPEDVRGRGANPQSYYSMF